MNDKEQPRFWFAHTLVNGQPVNLAVSAFTERQARIHVRRRVGKTATIKEINTIAYPHAWVINHGWFPAPPGEARQTSRPNDASS